MCLVSVPVGRAQWNAFFQKKFVTRVWSIGSGPEVVTLTLS
jgi:hypothetical protein